VFLGVACDAPPLTLTRALHRERPPQAQLVDGQFFCDVQAVRGDLAGPPGERALAVDVAFPQVADQNLPPHLQARGTMEAKEDVVRATFALSPADDRKRWPEDYAEAATRAAFGLRFQDARYFRDGTVAAEVTFSGTVAPGAVAQVVPLPPDLRSAPAWQAAAIPSGLAPLLRLVRRHAFGRLIGATPAAARDRCDPVAWVGPDDHVLRHEDVLLLLQPWQAVDLRRDPPPGLSVDECALLLRLVHVDGSVVYLRVSLPLLREGDDLLLVRLDREVAWSRREVWRARMLAAAGDTAAWPDLGLRLAATRIGYGFDELVPRSDLPAAILRTLLTPLAFAADVLAWHFPPLQYWLESIANPPRPFKPGGGNR